MKRFIEMIDRANSEGIAIHPELRKRYTGMLYGGDHGVGEEEKRVEEELVKDLLGFAEKACPFVFSPEGNGTMEDPPEVDRIEAAPFPIFSIELAGSAITHPHPEARNEIFTHCLLCIETKPGIYALWALLEVEGEGGKKAVMPVGKEFLGIVQHYVNRINKEKMGLEPVRVKMKVGRGKSKRRFEIRKVIHISPKATPRSEIHGSREIDWTHRFEVRGHWRRQLGIGKDREGNYCIEGFTWVKEHVRGPEALPLIKKQRVVTG